MTISNKLTPTFMILVLFILVSACSSVKAVEPPGVILSPGKVIATTQPLEQETARLPSGTGTATVPLEPTALQTTAVQPGNPFTPEPREVASATSLPTLWPDEWKVLPIIPKISDRALEIYQHGLELGNNPYAFSKVGDCGSTPAWFLGDFDRGEAFYNLGKYEFLSPVILAYRGSYERTSLAARSGFNTSSLLTTLWTDLKSCQVNETPLACEYRLHRPVIAFITLGTNDIWRPEEFEPQMRQIIEYSIENGVVPILATKADNAEGDGSINATIAKLAREYDIPLWNYWLAVQPLPGHGLQDDQAHLTWGRNFFDQPANLTKAWPVRNLTALQVLYQVWIKITGQGA
jgi:hypothetical protein